MSITSTTRRRVANHSLQSRRHWVGMHRIDAMTGAHLQNTLRLLVRSPLDQLIASHDANIWDACQVPDGMGGDETLPDGGQAIHDDLVKRWRWNQARAVAEADDPRDVAGDGHPLWFQSTHDAIDYLAAHNEPPTIEALTERAAAWIRRQPTFKAMRRTLVDKIIAGEAHITRDAVPQADPTEEPY